MLGISKNQAIFGAGVIVLGLVVAKWVKEYAAKPENKDSFIAKHLAA